MDRRALAVVRASRLRGARYPFGLCLCVSLLLAGCGGAATFTGGVFDKGIVSYRVGALARDWQRVRVDDNDLAFHHASLGTISINAMCEGYDDVPDEALLNQLLFGTRERMYRVEETLTVDGRGALHAVIDLELDGVPVTLEVYLVKKDGCVYDFTWIASRQAFEQGRPAFTGVVQGFHVLRTNLQD